MEISNIFLKKCYDISDAEKILIIKIWLGREGLHVILTLTQVEQELCQTVTRMFTVLDDKSRP